MAAFAGTGTGPLLPSDFGAGRLALADARLTLAVLNHGRHLALHRIFGVDREQANLLTFALLITGIAPAVAAVEVAARAPLVLMSAFNVGTGATALREATRSVAGPAASGVAGFEALLALALVGGVALPQLRRAAHAMRESERRIRHHRERLYANARAVMPGAS